MSVKLFELHRDEDITGVSGTGRVAVGVVFEDGTAVTHWLTAPYRSTTVWPTRSVDDAIAAIEQIHGHGGKTRIRWLGDESRRH